MFFVRYSKTKKPPDLIPEADILDQGNFYQRYEQRYSLKESTSISKLELPATSKPDPATTPIHSLLPARR